MELQTLASLPASWIDRISIWQKRLSAASPIFCAEDFILIILLLSAQPDNRSLMLGASLAGLGLLLILWVQAYGPMPQEPVIVGPFRFVRYPIRLALWLSTIALCLGARSFPGFLLGLGLLPILYHFDLRQENRQNFRQNLASRRYSRFVPALVPTFFPYHSEGIPPQLSFNWRQAWLGINRQLRGRLLRLLVGWVCLYALTSEYLPMRYNWVLALVWFAIVLLRAFILRQKLQNILLG